MRPKPQWAIDSEAIRERGIIGFANIQLVRQTKQLMLTKSYSAAIALVFKAGAFRY